MNDPQIVEKEDGRKAIQIEHTPATEAKVEAWLQEHQGHNAPIVVEQPNEKIVLPKDVVEGPSTDADLMKEILPSEPKVTVTEDDETAFFKALLTDEPLSLNIPVYDGKLTFQFRSRTVHEMERVLATVREDIREKIISDGDAALAYTRIQQYCVCLQLLKLNKEGFSEAKLLSCSALEEDKLTLRSILRDKIFPMGQIRWLAVVKGLIVFETKCRILSERCLNTDFSMPRE